MYKRCMCPFYDAYDACVCVLNMHKSWRARASACVCVCVCVCMPPCVCVPHLFRGRVAGCQEHLAHLHTLREDFTLGLHLSLQILMLGHHGLHTGHVPDTHTHISEKTQSTTDWGNNS